MYLKGHARTHESHVFATYSKYLVLRCEQLDEVSPYLQQSFHSFSLSSEVKKGSLSLSGVANISALSWERRDTACMGSNSTLLEAMYAGVVIYRKRTNFRAHNISWVKIFEGINFHGKQVAHRNYCC